MNDDDFPTNDDLNIGDNYRVTLTDNTIRDGFYDGMRAMWSFLAFYDIDTDSMFYVNFESVKILERLEDGNDDDGDSDDGDSDDPITPDAGPGGGEAESIPASKPVPATWDLDGRFYDVTITRT